MEFLEGLRLLGELLFEPLDGRRLVGDEKLELQHLSDGHALLVVFGHLLGQEIHPVPFGEPLVKPGIELRSGQGNSYTALDVEGHHAVEEQ